MAVILVAAPDRRRPNRVATPTCPRCRTDESVVALIRTAQFVYFRCDQCQALLPEAIPPMELRYGLVAHVAEHAVP